MMLTPTGTEEWGTTVVSAIAALLLLVAVWKWLSKDTNQASTDQLRIANHDSLCTSPDCVRCRVGLQAGGDLTALKESLLSKCDDYAVNVFNVSKDKARKYMLAHYPRVMEMISTSIVSKEEILKNVYRESGYTDAELPPSHPLIWMMPGLMRRPFWKAREERMLKETVVSVFENPETVDVICQEYLNISKKEKGWKLNSIPTGRWRVFPLINQGAKIEENCSQCPRTLQAVLSLPNFMQASVYGNAMFSVLKADSFIEPHTGPCNYRLRCHLPLVTPEGCSIQVGCESRSWRKGEVMVFDDSFVHAVRYEGESGSRSDVGGGGDCGQRVLLIFDVWHLQVEDNERSILTRIF